MKKTNPLRNNATNHDTILGVHQPQVIKATTNKPRMWRFYSVVSVASLQKRLSMNMKGCNLHKHLSQNIPKQPIYVTKTMKPRLKTRKRLEMCEIRRKNCQRQNHQKYILIDRDNKTRMSKNQPHKNTNAKKNKVRKKPCTFSISFLTPSFYVIPALTRSIPSYFHLCWLTNSATRLQSVRIKNWGAKTTSWCGWLVIYLFQGYKKPSARLRKQTGLILCQAHKISFSKQKQDYKCSMGIFDAAF